jgi:hypothetical protein
MTLLDPSPKATTLSHSLNHRLNAYTLAATAAGVSALAIAPAEAKIIYTPANISIRGGDTLSLNNSLTADFQFCDSTNVSSCDGFRAKPEGFVWHLKIRPVSSGIAIRGDGSLAGALASGAVIGSNKNFQKGHYLMAACAVSTRTTCSGPWLHTNSRYLGLAFKINGKKHYGWARLTTNWKESKVTLTGYAYESDAYKSIVAGQTSGPDEPADKTLGDLAVGQK